MRTDNNDRPLTAEPSQLTSSGTYTPAVIEDIQIKAELGRYRIRGFGPGIDTMPLQGPVLVVANHSAWMDPVISKASSENDQ